MNVHVSDELARRLNDLAAASGRRPEELVQDALSGYLDEVTGLREQLDARYDALKSGKVLPVDDADALAQFQAKSRARRSPSA